MALLKNRRFLMLWFATLVSTFCLSISWVVESWYAIKVLQRESEYGYILVAAMLPRLVFMAFGGVLADRFSRKHVISLSLMVRAALLGLLGLAMQAGAASFAVLVVFAFFYGALDAFYWPSRDAILSDVVPHEHLPQANAWMLATSQFGMILGPALGGVMAAQLDYSVIFYTLAATLCLAITLFYVRFQMDPLPEAAGVRSQPPGFMDEFMEGLRYVRRHQQLSVLMLIFAVANVLYMGPFQQSVPLLANHQMGGGATAFGTLWSAFGIGMCGGSLLMSVFAPKRRRFSVVVYVLCVQSLLLSSLAFVHHMVGGIAVMTLIGLCVAFNNVPTTGMLQTYSAREKLGRVMGLNDTLTMGLVPVSYLMVSALLMLGIGHQAILVVAGLAMFSFCLFSLWRFPVIARTD